MGRDPGTLPRQMEPQAWFTLAVVGLVLVAMVREVAAPDLIMMAGLFTLAAAGILNPAEVFTGFSNHALATVGALFILSAALRDTGAMEFTVGRLFGQSRNERGAAARILPPLAGMSGFLNNVTIVAMMVPVATDWARRNGIAPGRLLIPLNHATILGGTTTMIGTSTTLVVAGLMLDSSLEPMGFFELLPVGLALTVLGIAYLIIVAPMLIPGRGETHEELGEQRREYTAEMVVEPDSSLVDRSVEEAGLRHLPGLFLVEIDRGGHIITPIAPDELLQAGDRLVFAGVLETMVDLQRIRGLRPVESRADEEPRGGRRLMEAVVSRSSPLVGTSIRDVGFRTIYDAAVVAVHRNGERMPGKIGDIVLRPGDTLLLQTAPGFLRSHRNNADFFLVSEVAGSEAPRFDRAWVAIGTLVAMVLVVTTGLYPISIAAFLAAGILIGTRAISGPAARSSVQWHVLVVIGAALGIAGAMEKTGAASGIAELLVSSAGGFGPLVTLTVVYALTLALAETLNHTAAASIMFPIAVATANQLGVEPRGFVMAIAVASSCAFASPVTYQSHLIVYGTGHFRFLDFVRVGLPLDLLCAVVSMALIPRIWPF